MITGTFNAARQSALCALTATLAELRDSSGSTEQSLATSWRRRMKKDDRIAADGWYSPPPHGISVLAAPAANPARLRYASLRARSHWPSFRPIVWNEGWLFAYASPIDRRTGHAGDMAITLYFGSNMALKNYYRHAHAVVRELLATITPADTSRTIFLRAQDLWLHNGLRSATSTSDGNAANIGHSLPSLPPESLGAKLSVAQRDRCSQQRLFLSDSDEWPLDARLQFTIEPQLLSTGDPSLPQLSFHYIVRVKDNTVEVCNDVDRVLEEALLLGE